MFDFFRRMIVPIIMIALIGFLATIIFSWGADINSRKQYESVNLAAVINGEEITWNTYQRVYDNLIKAEQQNSDADITETKRDEIYETAWTQIQYDRLLMQEVNKYNISVSDDELYDFLKFSPPQDFQQSPTFQTNGRFDYQKYVNALADPNFASLWASYDSFFRTEIQKLKLQEMIIQAAHVTESEVKDYFVSLNEKIKIGMVNVNYAVFSSPGPESTEEEHLAYYDAHKENYKLEERAVLKIVAIEKKASREDWDAGLAQIQSIADSITAGANFADMAKAYSQDNSATSGGDLGWFKKGQMVPEFDRMVFSMKDGDISPPVKTQFGYHIIKHFGFKEETEGKEKVEKAKASHILIKVIASQTTLDAAYEQLNQFKLDSDDIGFTEASRKLGVPPQKTEPFVRGANMQYLGRNVEVSDFAFESEMDAISGIFEDSKVQFIVQLVEKIPEGIASYELSQKNVYRDLLKEKIQTLCADTSAAIWAEVQSGSSMKKASQKFGIAYEESIEFARGDYVKGLNQAPEAIGAAFGLDDKGDKSGPIVYAQGTVIIELLQKNQVDLNDFTVKKDSLSNIILVNKQQQVFGKWYDNLVNNSEIVNNINSIRASNRNY